MSIKDLYLKEKITPSPGKWQRQRDELKKRKQSIKWQRTEKVNNVEYRYGW